MSPYPPDNSRQPLDAGQKHLQQTLEHYETSLRLSDSWRLILKGTAGIAGFVLLVVALDHSLPAGLSWFALRIAGAGLAVLALIASGLVVRAFLRQMNSLYVARHLERSRGVAHNALLNWLLVRENRASQYAMGAGAAQADAELVAPTGDLSPIRPVRSHWSAVLAIAAAWVLFSVVTPKDITSSLRRLLGSPENAPSATKLVLLSPQLESAVYAGEPLVVEFEVRGRAAGELDFDILEASGDSPGRVLARHTLLRTVPSGKPDIRFITLTGNEIAADLHFRARAGDCELAGMIAVHPTPEVLAYDIEITPPKYLGLPAAHSKSPEIGAYGGSEAAWRITGNCDLHSPVFVFKGTTETRTRMSVSSSEPRTASVQMPLSESGSYWIEFADRWGRSTPRGTPHRVVLQGDQAPRVELVEPIAAARAADTVDLASAPWLRIAASDDWQLRSLQLVLERAGVIERRDLSISRTRPGEVVQVGIASEEIELAVGQNMKAWFEARDNRQSATGEPAPQLGRSQILTLRRSSANAIERGGKKAEPEVAQAEPGTMVETASSVKKPRGSGQGNDDSATGDGPGDNPSDAPGPEGGTARASQNGATATTEQPSDPDNSATIGQEAGADQPGTGSSDENIEKGNGEKGEGGKGDGDGNENGEGDGQSGDQATIENELRKFVERHGEEVQQAKESLDRKSLKTSNAETSSPPRARENSNDKPQNPQSDPSEPRSDPPQTNSTPENQVQNSKEQTSDPQGAAQKEGAPSDSPQSDDQTSDQPKDDAGKPNEKEGQSDPKNPGEKESNDDNVNKGADPSKKEGHRQSQPNSQERKQNTDQKKDEPGNDELKGEKTPAAEANAKKPQPNAPANDQSKPESSDPQPQEPEQADPPTDARAGKNGDPAAGPADEELPEGQRDSSRAAAPGAVNLPGGKPAANSSSSPGAPAQDDGPTSKQMGDSNTNQPRSEVQNLLELLERSEAIGPDALDDLPWPADKKAAFLRDLKRLDSLARMSSNQAAIQRWRESKPFGTRDIQYGRGAGALGDVGNSTMQADSIEKLANPPDQKVPPHLRPVLDAYYRSLANKKAKDQPR